MRLPLDQAISRAFGAAIVLLLLVVVLFGLARIIGGREARPAERHAASNASSRRLASAAPPKVSNAREVHHARLLRRLVAALALAVAGLVLVPAPAQADDYVPISGAGSTWSQVAVDAWRADVRASGVVVNFAGTGSTDGRSQFIQAHRRLRQHRDPVPEPARAGPAGRGPVAPTSPTCRSSPVARRSCTT